MRRILLAESEKGGLAATWSDGTTSFWPAIWLRDQCPCALCRHPSGQRLFEIGELPEHPRVERVAMQATGVRVPWRLARGASHPRERQSPGAHMSR